MSFHTKSFAYCLAFLTGNKNFHLSSLFMVFPRIPYNAAINSASLPSITLPTFRHQSLATPPPALFPAPLQAPG